nr:MAG TPA: hypothetical protein [Caudoviricetes sp.]
MYICKLLTKIRNIMEATFSTVYGETPHGGVKMTAYFFDDDMKPCIEKEAKHTRIIEYDKDGNRIFEVYS